MLGCQATALQPNIERSWRRIFVKQPTFDQKTDPHLSTLGLRAKLKMHPPSQAGGIFELANHASLFSWYWG